MQGYSFKAILEANGEEPKDWRQSMVYAFYDNVPSPHYGLRIKTHTLVKVKETTELYNLMTDPYQLDNISSRKDKFMAGSHLLI